MTAEENYKNVSDNLQTILLAFFAFLLFVIFFILLPYHDLTERYKVLKNMDFLSDQLNKSSDAIKKTLKNYSANDSSYEKNAEEIDNFTARYNTNLTKARILFNNISFNPATDQAKQEIQNLTRPAKPYERCYNTYTNFDMWISCNVQFYQDELRNGKNIIITVETAQILYNNISTLDKSIKKIQSNNFKHSVIDDKILKSWSALPTFLNDISKKNFNRNITLTYKELYELSNIGNNLVDISSIVPTIGTLESSIKKEIEDFNGDIKSLEFPLVGNAPFTLSQAFLSFPAVIAIAFPFISLQFKKLIKAHQKIAAHKPKHQNETQESLSWMDPFQGGTGKIYPILIIVLPIILLLVFLIVIQITWYMNIEYVENYTIITDRSLLIPQNKDDIRNWSILFLIIFLLAYIPLIKYAIGKG